MLVLFLLVLFLYDFKSRLVPLYIFISLFILTAIKFILISHEIGWNVTLNNLGFCVAFMSIQLITLIFWLRYKNKGFKLVHERYIGLGDILFMIILLPIFPFYFFMIYYLLSLILIIIGTIIRNQFSPNNPDETIPLAGYQALLLSFIFVVIFFSPKISKFILELYFII